MAELGDWAKRNSKTLILDSGETVEATYEGFKITTNPFDEEKEIVLYKLSMQIAGEPQTKIFKSTSGKAARFFDELLIGTRIKITRHGKGLDTRYDFSVLGTGNQIVQAGETEEEIPF